MNSKKLSDLGAFFEPYGVAVIGSLRESIGGAYGVIKNMLQFGFPGKIYPINPLYSEVLGLTAYSSVNQVAERIDLAVVITPPATVPTIIEQCAQKGIKAVLVVSEGFAEAGEGGAELQRQLVDITKRTEVRIIGPNTIGLLNTANGLVANPYFIGYERIRKGSIAFFSQTGQIGPQCQALEDRSYPISKMCDLGNMCDVNFVDVLNYLADDPETKVVAIHMEDVKDGRKFMDAARRLTAQKPLLIFKSGRSQEGARASASHTGSLTGSDQIYDAAFRQVGAIRVNTWEELWEMPRVFASQPLPMGNRIAIITSTGGMGVIATDAAVGAGLAIANFSPATARKLARMSPRLARNPVDIGPLAAVSDDPLSVLKEIIAPVLDDANVDCATITVPGGYVGVIPIIMDMFDQAMQRASKPVSIWIYGTNLSILEDMSRQLETRGLPAYFDLETAVKALGIAAYYSNAKLSLNH